MLERESGHTKFCYGFARVVTFLDLNSQAVIGSKLRKLQHRTTTRSFVP
jgi:hypothetical protein